MQLNCCCRRRLLLLAHTDRQPVTLLLTFSKSSCCTCIAAGGCFGSSAAAAAAAALTSCWNGSDRPTKSVSLFISTTDTQRGLACVHGAQTAHRSEVKGDAAATACFAVVDSYCSSSKLLRRRQTQTYLSHAHEALRCVPGRLLDCCCEALQAQCLHCC
jgi:hypothetical protein